MQAKQIITLLKLLNAQHIKEADEWVRCSCLFAKHKHSKGTDSRPSAGIHISPFGDSGYSCLTCHTNFINLESMVRELAFLNLEAGFSNVNTGKAFAYLETLDSEVFHYDDILMDETPDKVFKGFPESWLESFAKVSTVPMALDYLAKRRVPQQVCEELDLRFDYAKIAIGFPYHSAKGKLAGMRGRIIDPMAGDSYKHHDYVYNKINNTKFTWYRELQLDVTKPLVVVEGAFDCARVYQSYRNTTAIFTAVPPTEKFDYLLQFPKIYWLSDADPSGVKSLTTAKGFFKKTDVELVGLFLPSGYKDPSDMPAEQLRNLLEPHFELDKFIT